MTNDFDDALEQIRDKGGRRLAELWRQNAIEALDDVGDLLDYDVDEVKASFTEVRKQGDQYSFRVEHPAATIMEFGTSPHTIEPDDPDGTLSFENDDGETIFAKKVSHPGTEALLYISQSKQEVTVVDSLEELKR
jgi:hypothetical protein